MGIDIKEFETLIDSARKKIALAISDATSIKVTIEEKVEDIQYSALSFGVSFVQELYYKNLAGYFAFGIYPYREMGLYCNEWHYEKAGLRYYFDDFYGLFAGFAIKAHSFDAEYFEFSLGIRFLSK